MSRGPVGRPWRFDLGLAGDAGGPRRQLLERALVREIRRGRLEPGALLPGSRTLAKTLGINRKAVVAALDELVAQGWLEAMPARGTRVAGTLPEMPVADAQPSRATPKPRPAASARFILTDGAPDPRLAPLAAWGRGAPARAAHH
jgi:GntR family transcriptional regulator/MocR family aminotransferase